MSQDKSFRCQLVTPEAAIFDESVTFAGMTAHDGEFGVLRNRSPLLYRLGIGQLRVEVDGQGRMFYIDGGFAEVADNVVTVLTEKAIAVEDIDSSAVQKQLDELRASDDTEHLEIRMNEAKRLTTQLKLASR
jgi:F-type H+-transporting ATPase subunit epsilon